MSLIDTYFEFQVKYANQYGPNTIVFMEVGSFFEMYGADSKEGGQIIHRISNLLNLHVSRKNGKHKKDSPYMAGFPNYALEKYLKVLLEHSYTIIIVEQRMEEGHTKPLRSVTRILSPGTDLEHAPSFHSNNLVSLYIEIVQPIHSPKQLLYCGMATIDVTTGTTRCSEFYTPFSQITFAMSQIAEKLHSIHPSEIIWTYPKASASARLTNYTPIEKMLQSRSCMVHCIRPIESIAEQEHLFTTIYQDNGSLPVIQYLGLSRHVHARNAFAQLLQFVETHHAIALQKLSRPIFDVYDHQCILASSTLEQLQIITKGHQSMSQRSEKSRPSLFHIVNKCSTPMGKRCLFERLTHPIYDAQTLNQRYTGIKNMLHKRSESNSFLWKDIETRLDGIVDIERFHRRMQLQKLRPAECASFYLSYCELYSMLETISDEDMAFSTTTPSKHLVFQFIQEMSQTFDIDKMARYTLETVDESFFCTGRYSNIDDIQKSVEDKRLQLEQWRSQYSDLIDPTKTMVRLVTTDKDGTYMSLTKNRFVALKTAMSKHIEEGKDMSSYIPLDTLQIVRSKTDVKLKGGLLRRTSDEMNTCLSNLRTAVCEQYQTCLNRYCETYKELFHQAVEFISEIDFCKSGAKCATVLGYCCPEIQDGESNSSVKYTGIRHPIIEQIQKDIPYITNDILFDKTTHQGILLYGVNAAGKSSLMKAVGVNIILAQAGYFVAAQSMQLSPYRNIFTRLTKEDDMYEGLSSFAVEMTELRNILLRADEYSIVLGDELCSGTESISALAIVSAGIIQLYSRGTTFFFATHLHKLSQIPRLTALTKLKKYHLSVTYEPSSGLLCYDRKLSLGVGSSLYGLEVCKGMDMPVEFMEIASSIRENVDKTVIARSSSQYNSNVICYDCSVCGDIPVDTHHIQFQSTANKMTGMIGHIHKNRESNLVCLCKNCHHAVHHGQLDIYGYSQTTHGRILRFEWKKKPAAEKKKFKTNHVQWILERCQSDMPVHIMKMLFEKEFTLSISKASISKIRNGAY
jgi:DNA mismatch repair protein MutS